MMIVPGTVLGVQCMTCIAVHSTWHDMYACMILMKIRSGKSSFVRIHHSGCTPVVLLVAEKQLVWVMWQRCLRVACCELRVASCEGGIDHRHLRDCTPEGNVEGNYIFESADDSILRHLHLHECTSTWHY
jgi:hypothetical protein